MKVLWIALALLLPPVAVYLRTGAGGALALNLVLCLTGYLPGVVHAVWRVAATPRPSLPDTEAAEDLAE